MGQGSVVPPTNGPLPSSSRTASDSELSSEALSSAGQGTVVAPGAGTGGWHQPQAPGLAVAPRSHGPAPAATQRVPVGPRSPPAPACPDTLGDGGGTGRAGSAEPWRSGQLPALPRRLLAPAADAGLGCAREAAVPGGAQRGAVTGGCWGAPVRVHPPWMKIWGAFTRAQSLGSVLG